MLLQLFPQASEDEAVQAEAGFCLLIIYFLFDFFRHLKKVKKNFSLCKAINGILLQAGDKDVVGVPDRDEVADTVVGKADIEEGTSRNNKFRTSSGKNLVDLRRMQVQMSLSLRYLGH